MSVVEQRVALGMRNGKIRRRPSDPVGIIVHTTGAGPWDRHHKNPGRFKLPFDAALHIYEQVSPYCGHLVVCGETGAVAQLVPFDYQAQHVGKDGSLKYRKTNWGEGKGFGWWFVRHHGCESPRDLLGGALWRAGSANALTVGIEVSPPLAGAREPWSPSCWESLERLVTIITAKYQIPRTTQHVITHSDAHPLARTTETGAPWDVGPHQWQIHEAEDRLKLYKP
jgi:hypothetical protein